MGLAIYSLHHSNVGKATQAQPGTAGAHVRYITRIGAARLVMAEHMPTDRDQARSWMDEREATDRKNGRVIDKVMVALPVELDAAQRADVVRAFALEVGGGRIAWMAAVHDRGEDAHNPHAHIIIRDKDRQTGKRVFGTSEKGSTDRLREIWEDVANRALERAGIEARIDRRSLAEQGIDREAGLHIGPNVLAMEERGLRPVSLPQEVENGRVIDWPTIDQGRTRADRQREIEAGNLEAEHEREKGKDKDKGRAHVMTATPEAEQRAAAWAEREADRQAETQRQTEEQLALACQATPPAPPSLDSAAPDPMQAELKPEPQRTTAGFFTRLRERLQQTWKPAAQAEPMPTAEQAPVWQIPMPQPPGPAQAQGLKFEVSKVAGLLPEAIQRPSYEVASVDRSADRAETGRLANLAAIARLRLVNLAERLEAAFEPYRQRQAEQARSRAPEPSKPEPTSRPAGNFADDLLVAARQRQQQPEPAPSPNRPGRSLLDELTRRSRKPGEPGF